MPSPGSTSRQLHPASSDRWRVAWPRFSSPSATVANIVSRAPACTSTSVTTPSSTFVQPAPESVEMNSPPSVAA